MYVYEISSVILMEEDKMRMYKERARSSLFGCQKMLKEAESSSIIPTLQQILL